MAVRGGGMWTNTWSAGYIAAGQPAPPPLHRCRCNEDAQAHRDIQQLGSILSGANYRAFPCTAPLTLAAEYGLVGARLLLSGRPACGGQAEWQLDTLLTT